MQTRAYELVFRPHDISEGTILGFCGHDILLCEDGSLPHQSLFLSLETPKHAYHFGIYDLVPFSVYVWDENLILPQSLIKTNVRQLISTCSNHLFKIISRAKELVHWLHDNQFCGRCAAPTFFDTSSSALQCSQCGHMLFPRLSPACIVLVTHEDTLLLARSPYFASGLYSTLAGFVEAGESAEEAAHREVFEETGIVIKNLRYFGSQPWPFPHSLMIGFLADYDHGEIRLQEEEIEDAQWFTKDALPTLPHKGTIARSMIDMWLKNHS